MGGVSGGRGNLPAERPQASSRSSPALQNSSKPGETGLLHLAVRNPCEMCFLSSQMLSLGHGCKRGVLPEQGRGVDDLLRLFQPWPEPFFSVH